MAAAAPTLDELLKSAEAEQQKLSAPVSAPAPPVDAAPSLQDLLKRAEAEQQKLSAPRRPAPAGAAPPVLPLVTAAPPAPGGMTVPRPAPAAPSAPQPVGGTAPLSPGAPTPQDVQRMVGLTEMDIAAPVPPPPPRSFAVEPLSFQQSREEALFEDARRGTQKLPAFARPRAQATVPTIGPRSYEGAPGGPVERVLQRQTRATVAVGRALPRLYQEYEQAKQQVGADKQRLKQIIAESKQRGLSPSEQKAFDQAVRTVEENQRLLEQRGKRLQGYQGRYEGVLAKHSTKQIPGETEQERVQRQVTPLHSGILYPEEVAQREAGVGFQFGQHLGRDPIAQFINPAQMTSEALARLPGVRADLILEGKYPELPPLPGMLSPQGRQQFTREKNDALFAVITLGQALRPDGTLGREAVRPLTEAELAERSRALSVVKNLTPWQKKLLPILQQQVRAEREAHGRAKIGRAVAIDLTVGAIGEVVGGVAGKAAFRAARSQFSQGVLEALERKGLSEAAIGALEQGAHTLGGKRKLRQVLGRALQAGDIRPGLTLPFSQELKQLGLRPVVARKAAEYGTGIGAGALSGGLASGASAAAASLLQGQSLEEAGRAGRAAIAPGALIGGGAAGVLGGAADVAGRLAQRRAPAAAPAPPGAIRARPRAGEPVVAAPEAPGRMVTLADGSEIDLQRTSAEVLAQTLNQTPPEHPSRPVLERHLADVQGYQGLRQVELPPEAVPGFKKAWGDVKTPARATYDQLTAQAERFESTHPELAAKLKQAADEVQQDFIYDFTEQARSAQGEMLPVAAPPTASIWRQLTDAERAELPAAVRNTLLIQDINNSVQTLTPGVEAIVLPRQVPGKPKNIAAMARTADELFMDAQIQREVLYPLEEAAPVTPEPEVPLAPEVAAAPEVTPAAAPEPVVTPEPEVAPPGKQQTPPAKPAEETTPTARQVAETDLQPGARVVNPKTGAEFELVKVYESGLMAGKWQAKVIDRGTDNLLVVGRMGALPPELLTRDYQMKGAEAPAAAPAAPTGKELRQDPERQNVSEGGFRSDYLVQRDKAFGRLREEYQKAHGDQPLPEGFMKAIRAEVDELTEPFRDQATGLLHNVSMVRTIDRAIQHVRDTKEPGHYFEADIMNLGGLNDALTPGEADKVLRQLADFLENEVGQPGAHLSFYKKGGDELGGVVIGMSREQVGKALARAKQRADEWIENAVIKGKRIRDIPHTKPGKAPGTGFVYGIAEISPDAKAAKADVIDVGAAGAESGKKAAMQAYTEMLRAQGRLDVPYDEVTKAIQKATPEQLKDIAAILKGEAAGEPVAARTAAGVTPGRQAVTGKPNVRLTPEGEAPAEARPAVTKGAAEPSKLEQSVQRLRQLVESGRTEVESASAAPSKPVAQGGTQKGAGRKGGETGEVTQRPIPKGHRRGAIIIGPGGRPQRKSGRESLISRPELLEEVQKNAYPDQPSFAERYVPTLKRTWEGMTRTVPELPNRPEFAPLREFIRQQRSLDDIAAGEAAFTIQEEIGNLSPEQREDFAEALLLKNMAADVRRQAERWSESGKDPADFEPRLPGQWTDEALRESLDNVEAMLAKQPAVKKALDDLPRVRAKLTKELNGLYRQVANKEFQFDLEDYFHESIIAYDRGKQPDKPQESRRGKGTPGFTKERKQSGLAYYTDFVESESRWQTAAVRKIQQLKLWKLISDEYDVTPEVRVHLAELNDAKLRPELNAIAQGQSRPMTWDKLGKLAVDDALPDRVDGRYASLIDDLENFHKTRQPLSPESEALLPQYAKWLTSKRPTGRLGWRAGQVVPEGYVEIPIDELSGIFTTMAVPQNVLKQAQEKLGLFALLDPENLKKVMEQEGLLVFDASKLRQVMALGRRKTVIVPKEVAATLRAQSAEQQARGAATWDNGVNRGLRAVTTAWKVEKLLNPLRGPGYWIGNGAGDLWALFRGNRKAIVKVDQGHFRSKLWGAGGELAALLAQQRPPSPRLREWVKRGGLQGVITRQEGVGTQSGVDILGKFSPRPAGKLTKGWNVAQALVTMPHTWREGSVRYAAFNEFLDQIERDVAKGGAGAPDTWGASKPGEVMALKDKHDRAYKLANDLIGNYDQITAAGRYLRSHVIPFYSWMEVNARRELQMARNAWDSPAIAAAMGRKVAGGSVPVARAIEIGKFALKAASLGLLLDAYNELYFPGLIEKVSESARGRPILITGYDEERDEVSWMGRLDTVADFLSWFGLDNVGYSIPKAIAGGKVEAGVKGGYAEAYLSGRMTIEEIGKDMARQPVNRLWQGLGPQFKLPVEVVGGVSTFPNVFQTRPLRDRWETVFDQFGFGGIYRGYHGRERRDEWKVPGTPVTFQKLRWPPGSARADLSESAYHEMKGLAREWRQKQGKPLGGGGGFTPKGNTLYYHKRALQMGEEETANRHLASYIFEHGGTPQGYVQGLKALEPLDGLNTQEQAEFIVGLDQRDRLRLRRSYLHYLSLVAPELSGESLERLDRMVYKDLIAEPGAKLTEEMQQKAMLRWVNAAKRRAERFVERNNPLEKARREDRDVRRQIRKTEREAERAGSGRLRMPRPQPR